MTQKHIGKTELAATIAETTRCSKPVANLAAQALLDQIAGNLLTGAQVRLPGVGSLSLVAVPEGIGRHPRTGDEIIIEPFNKGRFKLAHGLKRRPAAKAAAA